MDSASTSSAPGSDEQQPGRQPASDAVQPPARIGRELHRLGPRQQHAEAECGKKTALVQPPLLIDENAMHQRDLCRRSAERKQADLTEHGHDLREGG